MPNIYHQVWICKCLLDNCERNIMASSRAHMSSATPGGKSSAKVSRKRFETPATNYGTSFQHAVGSIMKPRAKLRINPNPSWISRNKSNILPSGSGRSSSRKPRAKAQTKKWPWQNRPSGSEVFGSFNSNAVLGRSAQTQPSRRWQGHRRTQSSAEFLFGRELGISNPIASLPNPATTTEDENANPIAPIPTPRTVHRWPWQERAMMSLVFNQPEEKQPIHRTYKWDQRKQNVFWEVGQEQKNSAPLPPQLPKQMWPWQERARESHVFKEPAKEPYKGQIYPWDQRVESEFGVGSLDPEAKFEGVSRYNQDYLEKSLADDTNIIPAGKRYYGATTEINRPAKKQKGKNNKEDAQRIETALEDNSKEEKIKQNQTSILQDRTNKKATEDSLVSQFENLKIKNENDKLKHVGRIFLEKNDQLGKDENNEASLYHPVTIISLDE